MNNTENANAGSLRRLVVPLVEILEKDIARLKTHLKMWEATGNPMVMPSDGQCRILIDDLEIVVAALKRHNAGADAPATNDKRTL
jgi:hypothetical protein